MTYIPSQLRLTPYDGWTKSYEETRDFSDVPHKKKDATFKAQIKGFWYMWNRDTGEELMFETTEAIFKHLGIIRIRHLPKKLGSLTPYNYKYFFKKNEPFTEDEKKARFKAKKEINPQRTNQSIPVLVMDLFGEVIRFDSTRLAAIFLDRTVQSLHFLLSGKRTDPRGYQLKYENDLRPWKKVSFIRITELETGKEHRVTSTSMGDRAAGLPTSTIRNNLRAGKKVFRGIKVEMGVLN